MRMRRPGAHLAMKSSVAPQVPAWLAASMAGAVVSLACCTVKSFTASCSYITDLTDDAFRSFWMELAPLAPGARPVLQEDEVECILREDVTILDGHQGKAVYSNGVALLTSRRIVWYETKPSGGRVVQGHLSRVVHARKSRNIFRSAGRVHVFTGGQDHQGGDTAATKLDFLRGGRDEFLEQLRQALQVKEWERAMPQKPQGPQGTEELNFATSKAGISGILKQKERERLLEGKLAEEAFTDLQSLMGKASEVVAVVGRYAAVLARKKEAAGEDAGAADDDESKQLQGVLLDIGIANPVTRISAGSLYHKELARQLADFLKRGDKLASRGGMITLPDAFCLFNRARGTELISPEDLLDACKLFESLHLGMHIRSFSSGVLVIQADDFSDENVSQRVRTLADAVPALTALEVASRFHVSITLAQEFLKTSENAGLMCRDESVQGVLFYPNRFPEYLAGLEAKS